MSTNAAVEAVTKELNQRRADASTYRAQATEYDVKAKKAEQDVIELTASLDALAKAPPPAAKPAVAPAPAPAPKPAK